MARFKVTHEMESRGMKGAIAGGKTTAGNPRYYKFRTTSLYRETDKRRCDVTPESDNIKMPEINEEDLLKSLPQACVDYDRLLRHW